jgi:hypothetical protein
MNSTSWNTALRSDLPVLGVDLEEYELSSGGTPFFNACKKALEARPTLTRLIVFTDGAPTDKLEAEADEDFSIAGYYSFDHSQGWTSSAKVIITIAKHVGGEKCIPIDTVYFGGGNERNMSLLRYLSDNTGGFFLHFDPAKVNFKTAFKYLAPVNRLRLTSGSFRASLERGEQQ